MKTTSAKSIGIAPFDLPHAILAAVVKFTLSRFGQGLLGGGISTGLKARAKDENSNGTLADAVRSLTQAQANLTQAQASLAQAQATMVANQAAFLERLATQEAESARRFARIEERFSRIDDRFNQIEAILLEHNRILQALPEAIREKIGFRPTERNQAAFPNPGI
jgi:hypothetical protein